MFQRGSHSTEVKQAVYLCLSKNNRNSRTLRALPVQSLLRGSLPLTAGINPEGIRTSLWVRKMGFRDGEQQPQVTKLSQG